MHPDSGNAILTLDVESHLSLDVKHPADPNGPDLEASPTDQDIGSLQANTPPDIEVLRKRASDLLGKMMETTTE